MENAEISMNPIRDTNHGFSSHLPAKDLDSIVLTNLLQHGFNGDVDATDSSNMKRDHGHGVQDLREMELDEDIRLLQNRITACE